MGYEIPITQEEVDKVQEIWKKPDGCVIKNFEHERDYYMFENLVLRSPGQRVAAFVGLGHIYGIE